jgi:TPR repeat protein
VEAQTELGVNNMARFDMSAATASETNSADALFHLGMVYCIGREVETDLVAAHKWFNLAALRGSTEARQYRCEISREMSPAQIAEAQRQARAWLTTH